MTDTTDLGSAWISFFERADSRSLSSCSLLSLLPPDHPIYERWMRAVSSYTGASSTLSALTLSYFSVFVDTKERVRSSFSSSSASSFVTSSRRYRSSDAADVNRDGGGGDDDHEDGVGEDIGCVLASAYRLCYTRASAAESRIRRWVLLMLSHCHSAGSRKRIPPEDPSSSSSSGCSPLELAVHAPPHIRLEPVCRLFRSLWIEWMKENPSYRVTTKENTFDETQRVKDTWIDREEMVVAMAACELAFCARSLLEEVESGFRSPCSSADRIREALSVANGLIRCSDQISYEEALHTLVLDPVALACSPRRHQSTRACVEVAQLLCAFLRATMRARKRRLEEEQKERKFYSWRNGDAEGQGWFDRALVLEDLRFGLEEVQSEKEALQQFSLHSSTTLTTSRIPSLPMQNIPESSFSASSPTLLSFAPSTVPVSASWGADNSSASCHSPRSVVVDTTGDTGRVQNVYRKLSDCYRSLKRAIVQTNVDRLSLHPCSESSSSDRFSWFQTLRSDCLVIAHAAQTCNAISGIPKKASIKRDLCFCILLRSLFWILSRPGCDQEEYFLFSYLLALCFQNEEMKSIFGFLLTKESSSPSDFANTAKKFRSLFLLAYSDDDNIEDKFDVDHFDLLVCTIAIGMQRDVADVIRQTATMLPVYSEVVLIHTLLFLRSSLLPFSQRDVQAVWDRVESFFPHGNRDSSMRLSRLVENIKSSSEDFLRSARELMNACLGWESSSLRSVFRNLVPEAEILARSLSPEKTFEIDLLPQDAITIANMVESEWIVPDPPKSLSMFSSGESDLLPLDLGDYHLSLSCHVLPANIDQGLAATDEVSSSEELIDLGPYFIEVEFWCSLSDFRQQKKIENSTHQSLVSPISVFLCDVFIPRSSDPTTNPKVEEDMTNWHARRFSSLAHDHAGPRLLCKDVACFRVRSPVYLHVRRRPLQINLFFRVLSSLVWMKSTLSVIPARHSGPSFRICLRECFPSNLSCSPTSDDDTVPSPSFSPFADGSQGINDEGYARIGPTESLNDSSSCERDIITSLESMEEWNNIRDVMIRASSSYLTPSQKLRNFSRKIVHELFDEFRVCPPDRRGKEG